jgi:uncharacterized Zn finger protein
MGWGYFEYVPVAKKRESAAKSLAKLKKTNPNISPVVIEGKKIANTWWSNAWNKNLESYADYSNRIGRGRSYVRNGAVLDLQISTGIVNALVQGSGKRPYKIEIKIAALSDGAWSSITAQCGNKIGSMAELAEGRFPKEFEELFLRQGEGLFPMSEEIELSCSCPDWAHMCKHVAAALYGIGARFDSDPLLFFELRGIKFEELLKKSVEEKIGNMLKNADKKSSRVIEDKDIDISALFGL